MASTLFDYLDQSMADNGSNVRSFGDVQRPRTGVKSLRREDEPTVPEIPQEIKDMMWKWLRTWKLTARKLSWSDYCLGRVLDNLEESFSDVYYTDFDGKRGKESADLYKTKYVDPLPAPSATT
jgi:hypothetical protein